MRKIPPRALLWGLEVLLGYDFDGWVAVAAALQTIVSFLVLVVGWRQLSSLRSENRKWYTLEYINRYDTDPVLHECLKQLRHCKLNQTLEKSGEKIKTEAAAVLNYIDGLAIGIDQGLYIDAIARDHLEPIVSTTIKTYLDDDRIVKALGIQRDHYTAAKKLEVRWSKRPLRYSENPGRRPWANWRRRDES